MLLATPTDSRDLVALDLVTGRSLWALDHGDLEAMARAGASSRTRHQVLDVLLGADEDAVFLGGRIVAALEAPAGLATEPPTSPRWTIENDAVEGTRVRIDGINA